MTRNLSIMFGLKFLAALGLIIGVFLESKVGMATVVASPSLLSIANSYIGPGDVLPGWNYFYGLRAYNRASCTGLVRALQVTRASDSTSRDITILANCRLDIATLTSFLASTTGVVTKWYDQTGNGNDATNTASVPPLIALNVLNGYPAVAPNGAQGLAGSASGTSQPYTAYAITMKNDASNGGVLLGFNNAVNPILGSNSPSTIDTRILTGVSVSAEDGVWHGALGVFNNASSYLNVDGSTATGSVSSTQAAGFPFLFSNQYANGFFKGNAFELGFISGDHSASAAGLLSNAKIFYGY